MNERMIKEDETGLLQILRERRRQVSVEGWTAEHDDAYNNGELVKAARCYAMEPGDDLDEIDLPEEWPWPASWWKPSPLDRKRELVKAGALIVAEIDRLDRLERASAEQDNAEPVQDNEDPMSCSRVQQTRLWVKDMSHGNCFSAVLAGLLKLPIEEVPDIFDQTFLAGRKWYRAINEWLAQFGMAYISEEDLAVTAVSSGANGLWHTTYGVSPRDSSIFHALVSKDRKTAWDPHPDETGIVGSPTQEGLFIVLRPWEMVEYVKTVKG